MALLEYGNRMLAGLSQFTQTLLVKAMAMFGRGVSAIGKPSSWNSLIGSVSRTIPNTPNTHTALCYTEVEHSFNFSFTFPVLSACLPADRAVEILWSFNNWARARERGRGFLSQALPGWDSDLHHLAERHQGDRERNRKRDTEREKERARKRQKERENKRHKERERVNERERERERERNVKLVPNG